MTETEPQANQRPVTAGVTAQPQPPPYQSAAPPRSASGIRPSTDFQCSQLPGYLGFCPQVKYNYGQTFGNQTRNLAVSKLPHRHLVNVAPVEFVEAYRNALPEPTGQNRYTKDLIPGYSGFIPGFNFQHSKTYTRQANECVDDFIDNKKKLSRSMGDLHRSCAEQRQLSEAERGSQDFWQPDSEAEAMPSRMAASAARRAADEPPMPGYGGHVPRKDVTAIGVGSRFHVVSAEGLDDFYTRYHFKFGERFPGNLGETHPVSWPTQSFVDDSIRKAYYREGVLPKFDGHIPQSRYRHGRTIGDTSRALEVCNHDFRTYGEYLRAVRSGQLPRQERRAPSFAANGLDAPKNEVVASKSCIGQRQIMAT